jgi:hypothetical protein
MSINCVYLTTYFGNKMPMFYLGSSTKNKILNGYRGSVASKKYKAIWKEELKTHPELFKTAIVSLHDTREEAFIKEEKLQKQLNVINNVMYVNRSYANYKFTLMQHSPYTKSNFKKRIPWNKGKTGIYSEEARRKMGPKKGRPGKQWTPKMYEKLCVPNPAKAMHGIKNGMYGKTHSDENKKAQGHRATKQFKGKTYEKLLGEEQAARQKKYRSMSMIRVRKENPFNGNKNPRYDSWVYRFYNTKTGEIVESTRWVFYNRFRINKGGTSDMINKGITYDGWCVLYS